MASNKFQKGNRTAHGGARPNAGRKPDAIKAEAKSFFETMQPLADSQLEKALTGKKVPWKERMKAIELVYAYRLGKPKQQVNVSQEMVYKMYGEGTPLDGI